MRLKLGQKRRTFTRQVAVQALPMRQKASRGRKASVHRWVEGANGEDAYGGDEPIGKRARDGRERAYGNQAGQKGGAGDRASTRFLAWRASGRRDSVRASIMAFDEMWTYLGIRRGERRQDL